MGDRHLDFSNWVFSNYAAWWGAIVATAALGWNIISALRSGPRIKVRATPNMQIFPRMSPTGDKTYISVTAINKGTAPTTITHLSGFYAKNFLCLVRRKRKNFIVSTVGGLSTPIPHVLRPGEEWSGMIDQESLTEKYHGGYLYVGVIHNQRRRPVYVRVLFKESGN